MQCLIRSLDLSIWTSTNTKMGLLYQEFNYSFIIGSINDLNSILVLVYTGPNFQHDNFLRTFTECCLHYSYYIHIFTIYINLEEIDSIELP